ncbi:peptidylprolyl isomerase [Tsuneonella flava]|nr:peptidylprolyl isomerase [Tsuneonella flava]
MLIRTALAALFMLHLASPSLATESDTSAPPGPSDIVAHAPPSDWVPIRASDLLVMTLAPDAEGKARHVVIQLMPRPFSQSWIANIRTLAHDRWWDGLAITRVQDNYVVQWGDPNGEDAAKAKALPAGLTTTSGADYTVSIAALPRSKDAPPPIITCREGHKCPYSDMRRISGKRNELLNTALAKDAYAPRATFRQGWPIAMDISAMRAWPVHCYGMVGVGRNYSPDAGTGAELYTVIGQAPRHLDRNIALVGRVIEGMENLSSLPRGTGALGFYEDPTMHIKIESIRLASDLPANEQPRFAYLDTGSMTFARYVDARANRRDPFFIVPAGGVDICNAPVPVRHIAGEQ